MSGNADTNVDIFEHAKKPLFDLLLIAGIGTVTVEFQGGGDEGTIDACVFTSRDGSVATMDHCSLSFNGGPDGSVTEYVEKLCDAVLEQTELDWWNNDGGQGTITLDPTADTIKVEIGINYQDTDDHEFEY